jgi:hypothetical protein
MMCKNVGMMDRTARGLIGVTALILAFTVFHVTQAEIPGVIAAVVGVVMLLTAAIGMCPLYVPMKISTCKRKG